MQDGQNYLDTFLTGLAGGVITWLGRWLFDRHREQKEEQKSEVELADQVARLWRETSQELEGKIKELRAEMNTMLTEMETVKEENRRLKAENTNLKNEQDKLKKRLAKFEKEHGE